MQWLIAAAVFGMIGLISLMDTDKKVVPKPARKKAKKTPKSPPPAAPAPTTVVVQLPGELSPEKDGKPPAKVPSDEQK